MDKVNHVIGAEIETLQRETFGNLKHEVNSVNGLVIDKTAPDSPASIAATGFALADYPVGVERGFISRAAAVERTLMRLLFFQAVLKNRNPTRPAIRASINIFWICKPDDAPGNLSYQRWRVPLLAGVLTAAAYFDAHCADEEEIRTVADALYRRADWRSAQNEGATLTRLESGKRFPSVSLGGL